MDRLSNDTRDILLTPEFVAKSDKDIATITSLNELAARKGATLVLVGGYATEAICGGKITRAHSDIDLDFIFDTTQIDNKGLFAGVKDILDKEDTKWKRTGGKEANVNYIEDDENKVYINKRRLEVAILLKGTYSASFQPAELIDSEGRIVKVMVLDLTDLIVKKMQKLYYVKNGIGKATRPSGSSDYYDLKRLLALPQFNKSAVMEKLEKRAKSVEKAQEQWDYSMSLI